MLLCTFSAPDRHGEAASLGNGTLSNGTLSNGTAGGGTLNGTVAGEASYAGAANARRWPCCSKRIGYRLSCTRCRGRVSPSRDA